jgi:hypothetical protein
VTGAKPSALLLAAALGLLAAACGGSSAEGVAQVGATTTTTTTTDESSDPAAYSACMRSHGVADFPDPDSKGRIRLRQPDTESPRFRAAAEACAKLRAEERAPSPAELAEDRKQFLAFSACMREHGLAKFPDPDADGISLRRTSGIDPDSPRFRAAEKACEDLLPGAGTQ